MFTDYVYIWGIMYMKTVKCLENHLSIPALECPVHSDVNVDGKRLRDVLLV